ncbi:hypothetical protein NDU88_012184, partial [Pleurodeles waltl]
LVEVVGGHPVPAGEVQVAPGSGRSSSERSLEPVQAHCGGLLEKRLHKWSLCCWRCEGHGCHGVRREETKEKKSSLTLKFIGNRAVIQVTRDYMGIYYCLGVALQDNL